MLEDGQFLHIRPAGGEHIEYKLEWRIEPAFRYPCDFVVFMLPIWKTERAEIPVEQYTILLDDLQSRINQQRERRQLAERF